MRKNGFGISCNSDTYINRGFFNENYGSVLKYDI